MTSDTLIPSEFSVEPRRTEPTPFLSPPRRGRPRPRRAVESRTYERPLPASWTKASISSRVMGSPLLTSRSSCTIGPKRRPQNEGSPAQEKLNDLALPRYT